MTNILQMVCKRAREGGTPKNGILIKFSQLLVNWEEHYKIDLYADTD